MGKICNERMYHLKCTGKLNCPLIAEKLVFEKNKNFIELAIFSSSKMTPGNFEFLKPCKINHPLNTRKKYDFLVNMCCPLKISFSLKMTSLV